MRARVYVWACVWNTQIHWHRDESHWSVAAHFIGLYCNYHHHHHQHHHHHLQKRHYTLKFWNSARANKLLYNPSFQWFSMMFIIYAFAKFSQTFDGKLTIFFPEIHFFVAFQSIHLSFLNTSETYWIQRLFFHISLLTTKMRYKNFIVKITSQDY